MGAGVPGMGIASMFYVVAALLAPLFELPRTLIGRSSWWRWRCIILQFSLAVLIIGSVVGTYLGINWLIDHNVISVVGPRPLRQLPNYVWTALALAFVLVVASIAAWVVGGDTYTVPIAAAHRESAKLRPVVHTKTVVPATQAARAVASASYHQ